MLHASQEESKQLDTEPSAPLFLLTTVAYLADSTPVAYLRTFWVGDRMRLHVKVSAYALNLVTTERLKIKATGA
ncbi:MAG TPA: UTRA domain-containing protein [Anaerolineae bacterium]|nr:UTRA domain-containing protein [Anaerolineae bacterium]